MRTRALALILLFWGLAWSGWASIPPPEPTAAVVTGIPDGARRAEEPYSTIKSVMHAMVRSMVGATIARSMDDVDWKMVLHSLEFGRAGVPSRWRNPESRNTYTVTLIRAYDVAEGPCLEYTVVALIAGKGDKAHNTACRLSDGNWRVTDDH